MKTCIECNNTKSLDQFPIHSARTGNRRNQCNTCWKTKRDALSKTFVRRAKILFNCMKYRLKTDSAYRSRRCSFSQDAFLSWILQDEQYHGVYTAWVMSDFKYQMTPTIDRIDNSGNYTLNNIQILPMFLNNLKDKLRYTVAERTLKDRELSRRKRQRNPELYRQLERNRYQRNRKRIRDQQKARYHAKRAIQPSTGGIHE